MPNELKFKVSAELKNILGRDLITSPNIAVLELVKIHMMHTLRKLKYRLARISLLSLTMGRGCLWKI